jgi:hypothetical protein
MTFERFSRLKRVAICGEFEHVDRVVVGMLDAAVRRVGYQSDQWPPRSTCMAISALVTA